ncbi:MAG TPA: hypothetical protein VGU46_09280 [Acidobacteriaceae bacterium]|nr:hypothetical protein [Acidobacteriaceae bacterium]
MNASLESPFQVFDSGAEKVPPVVRGDVVNRTHRVVRERAQAMQARRSRARGLMVPMAICAVLLVLMAGGMWSGLYQNPAVVETLQSDVAALTTLDASRESMVALMWFVPACLAVAGAVLLRVANKGGR